MREEQNHKVKVTQWKDGKLHTEEHNFDSLEESMEHSKKFKGDVKIYKEDEIIHHEHKEEKEKKEHHKHETYA